MRPLESFGEEEVLSEISVEPSEGFVIEELEMNRFMRYLDKTVPPLRFPEKYTVITGKTGSGKTSILDAITFALYKRSSRTEISGVSITDVCKKGGHVRLVFHQGGSRYEVRRGITSAGSSYLELSKNGSPISGTIPELEAIIKDIVGLDYDGFRNSTFVRQEEMKELGAESGSKRLEIFQKLFRLETFSRAQEIAKQKYDNVLREINASEREIDFRRDALKKLPEFQRELESRVRRFTIEKERLDNLKKELLGAEERLRRSEKDHEDYLRLTNEIETKRRTINEIAEKIRKKELDSKESKRLRRRIEDLEKEMGVYDNLIEEREKLSRLEQKDASLREKLELHNKQRERIEKEFREKIVSINRMVKEDTKRISELSTDINAEEAFRLLRTEGSLTERIARIQKEIEWLKDRKSLVKKIKAEGRAAERRLASVSERVSGINVDSFTLSEIEKNIAKLKRHIEEERERQDSSINRIEKEMEKLREEITKIGFDEQRKRRLEEISSRIEELRDKKEILGETRERLDRIGDIKRYLEDLNSQKESEESILKDLERREKERRVEEERYKKNKENLEKLRKREKELDKLTHGLNIEIKELQERIAEMEKDAAGLKRLERSVEELRSKSEVYSLLKDNILHKKGVVMYAINQLLPTLEIETSQNLSDLTDGRFSRVRLRTHEEERGYGIKIEVEGADGEWHDVAEFSGGERTQINAALRFAIAKELASMPQVGRTYGRMKTLFIDEGDLGSLDTEVNRDLFVQKLFNMGEFFDKIILITHLVEVADKFPGKIRVHMTPEQESRIEIVR